MRGFTLAVLISFAGAGVMEAQIDWPSFGGDSQRTGWERSDTRITRENVKDFELVLKRKIAGPHAGPRSLTPPVIVGLLISYRGFKELAFAADGSDTIWSVDADLNRVFWKRQFEPEKARAGAAVCAQTVATMPARCAAVADPHAGLNGPGAEAFRLDALLEMSAADERDRGLGDLPYPPDYPKMPGEPPRVQPSRARRVTSED